MIAPIRHDPPTTRRRDLRKARRWIADGVLTRPTPNPSTTRPNARVVRLMASWIVFVAGAYLWFMVGRPLVERWF